MATGKKLTVNEAGRLGGKARASRLSSQRRKKIASLAAVARWKKHRRPAGHALKKTA